MSLAVVFILFYFSATPAHAIIFLPALILIPIAKIIAVLIGGFSLPALGTGLITGKLFKKSVKKTLGIVAISLVLFGAFLFFLLRFLNPDRPLF